MVNSKVLYLISGNEPLIIPATDGTETLAAASDVFDWISPNFQGHGLNVPVPATPQIGSRVYQLYYNMRFNRILNFRKLSLFFEAQSQVISFVREHKVWLARGSGSRTFFPFKINEIFGRKEIIKRFIVDVEFDERAGLCVDVIRFVRGSMWYPGHGRRFVLPQQHPAAV